MPDNRIVSKERLQILNLLSKTSSGLAPGKIAEYFKKPPGSIRRILYEMKQSGQIHRWIDGTYHTEAEPDDHRHSAEPDLEERIRTLLKGNNSRRSVSELSDLLDRSERTVRDVIRTLHDKGYNVTVTEDGGCEMSGFVAPGGESIVHPISDFQHRRRKFGLVSDNHLGSKHERLDVLNALYNVFEAEGIDTVLNAGNWIEGQARFNRHDIKVFGLDNQIEYFLEHYPQRKGITTLYVAGDDHEGWYQQREQLEIGRYVERAARDGGRNDLKYLGYVEADIELKAEDGSRWLKLMHPGGGSAYAFSYAPQKLLESFQGGEKPSILVIGHYHKFEMCYPRESTVVQCGATCDQSIFMRKQKIQAMVGGCILEFNQMPDGNINRVKVEWIPFYDRGYYTGKLRKF